MVKAEIMQFGNVMPTRTRGNPNQGRVYNTNYICPSITDISGGGGREPHIIVWENGMYRIRRLTARECGRLMNVEEDDINKMLSVNSESQCYKQFGNSIVVACLMAIFSQLNIDGIKPWNSMTDEERYKMIYKGCVVTAQPEERTCEK